MPPACEPRRSYRSSSPISIVTGCSSGSSRARACPRESGGQEGSIVILSPILLEILHEWWRVARKKGWMSPAPPWLFPGCRHDDRDRRCRPLGGEWGQGSESDDHIHIEADQFGSKHWQPVAIVIRGPILECKVLAFDPSELAKAVAEHAVQMCLRPQRSLRCGCQSCRPSPLAGPASCSATRRSRRP